MRGRFWPPVFFLTILFPLGVLFPHLAGPTGFVSLLAGRPVPIEPGPGKGPYEAVYLIIIDGLRYDVAHSSAMPFLGRLKSSAAWGKVRVGLPSYSRPGYARLLTGAPSELTGLTMNDQTKPAPVPTIFSLAREAGLATAAAAHYWIGEIVGEDSSREGSIQYGYFYRQEDEPDARVFARAKEAVRRYRPGLVLVLPAGVDVAGHRSGGDSQAYREAAAAVDIFLADFCHSLPPDGKHLVIITADHGHRDAGGHGGKEKTVLEVPVFFWGPGVRPGPIEGLVDQLDIAPTVAAALGLSMPGSMLGRVLTEAFGEKEPWAGAQARLEKAQQEYFRTHSGFFIMREGMPSAEVWRVSRRAAQWRGALWRLPLALVLAGGLVFSAVVFLSPLKTRWPVLAGLAFPLYFYAFLRLFGGDYSYSVMKSAGDFFFRVLAAAGVALIVSTWAGASLRHEREPFFPPLVVGVWIGQSLLFFIAWVVAGGRLVGFLPDLGWHVFFLVQAVLTPLTSLYAFAGWWFGVRRKKKPEEAPAQGISG